MSRPKQRSAPRDVKALLRRLDDLEIEYTLSGAGHYKVFAPGGVVFMPSTPSEYRSIRNTAAQLRRHGCQI
jgi:hypothetical protein